jgi:hypothetical protein
MSDEIKVEETMQEEAKCPSCGSKVYWLFACHTYLGSGDVWMACMNCDSATEYCCDEGCGWYYIEGYNSKNPRFAENEARKPTWSTELDNTWGAPLNKSIRNMYDDSDDE